MKLNVFACLLIAAATALLPSVVGAAPPIHAPSRQHKTPPAKPGQRSSSAKPFQPKGKAFILNFARPGMDPNRGDHMAMGQGMHPEQMDHMNTVTPVPTVPATPTMPTKPKRLTKPENH